MKKTLMILFLSGFLAIFLVSQSLAISLVDASWLSQNMNKANIRIVDVQAKSSAYAKEHIPGAVKVARYIDLSDVTQVPPTLYPTVAQFQDVVQRLGIDKDTVIVAYDDKFNLFSSRFLVMMEIYGHDVNKLKLLDGGLVNWKMEGKAVTSEPTKVASSSYQLSALPDANVIAWSDVYRDVVLEAKPEVALLDVRPDKEYKGENIRGIRGGHVPKAINVTGSNANDADTHKYKALADIRKMYEDSGLTSDKAIYLYCHSGDRAAHAYIQLHHLLGYKNVKFYPGGWNEWNAIISLPVEGAAWLWE